MPNPDNDRSRRQFLATAGVAVSPSLGGCLVFGDSEQQAGQSDSTPTPIPGPTSTPTSTPADEAMETPTAADRYAEGLEPYTTPLETVAPAEPLDDLAFLEDALADATIVGMGEATHGTREFFRFKHRLVRYMAEELGLRVFTIEAHFSETVDIDRYIRTGEGDAESAVAKLSFWTWQVESVLEMVEWMREFNKGRDPDDKIRFYGVDMQSGVAPISELEPFFETVDEEFLDSLYDARGTFRSDTDEEIVEWGWEFVAELRNRLQDNEDEFVAVTSRGEYEIALRHARVLEQFIEVQEAWLDNRDSPEAFNVRDSAMAENTRWVLEREEADNVALWMHNAHVSREAFEWPEGVTVPTGSHLADWYGDDYYVVGMEFGHGFFRSTYVRQLRKFSVDPAPEDTLPGILSNLELPYAYVDVEAASGDDEVSEWLAEPRRRHSIGAAFNPDQEDEYRFVEDSIVGRFDGLLFVDESTASRML